VVPNDFFIGTHRLSYRYPSITLGASTNEGFDKTREQYGMCLGAWVPTLRATLCATLHYERRLVASRRQPCPSACTTSSVPCIPNRPQTHTTTRRQHAHNPPPADWRLWRGQQGRPEPYAASHQLHPQPRRPHRGADLPRGARGVGQRSPHSGRGARGEVHPAAGAARCAAGRAGSA